MVNTSTKATGGKHWNELEVFRTATRSVLMSIVTPWWLLVRLVVMKEMLSSTYYFLYFY